MSRHHADRGDEHDEALRRRLRAADPASSLADAGRADPDRVARLLEDVMSTEPTTESRESGTRDRGPLTWLVAAAAAAVIAGVAAFALVGLDDSADPPAADDAQVGADATVTELTAPDEAAFSARCMAPTAAAIGGHDLAVDATVTAIVDDLVTLEPSRWYAGTPTDLVQVQAPPALLRQVLAAVDFEPGGRYLVAATDGEVAICGQSDRWHRQLADLYAEAFGTPADG